MNTNPTETPDLEAIRQRLNRLTSLFVVLTALLLVVLGFLCTGSALAISDFERLFSEMLGDKPLPFLTQLSINLGRTGGGLALPLLTVALPSSALILLFAKRHDTVAWTYAVTVIVLLCIVVVLIPYSLGLPFVAILKELSGQLG